VGIGKRLRNLRVEKNMSQGDIEAVGCSFVGSGVGKKCNGGPPPCPQPALGSGNDC
jgi:hypothetical protein